MLSVLLFLVLESAAFQAVPEGWKVVTDSKKLCRIAVPPEWVPLGESAGAAVLQDAANAIAVVTSQPGQSFQPLTEGMQKVLGIRRGKVFENTARRIFYQDQTSRKPEDPNAYSSSVPAKAGTCSCRVAFVPGVSEETVKKIIASLGPVRAGAAGE